MRPGPARGAPLCAGIAVRRTASLAYARPSISSHGHFPVPHRRACRETFGCINDGVGVDVIVAIEVVDGAGLAEMLDAQRFQPLAAHAAQPSKRCRMTIDHAHNTAISRQWGQKLFDMAEMAQATVITA